MYHELLWIDTKKTLYISKCQRDNSHDYLSALFPPTIISSPPPRAPDAPLYKPQAILRRARLPTREHGGSWQHVSMVRSFFPGACFVIHVRFANVQALICKGACFVIDFRCESSEATFDVPERHIFTATNHYRIYYKLFPLLLLSKCLEIRKPKASTGGASSFRQRTSS